MEESHRSAHFMQFLLGILAGCESPIGQVYSYDEKNQEYERIAFMKEGKDTFLKA